MAGRAGHHAQQPQNHEYYRNRIQHKIVLDGFAGPAPLRRPAILVGLAFGHGYCDGHVVHHTAHTSDVSREFGDEALFCIVPGYATDGHHAIGR